MEQLIVQSIIQASSAGSSGGTSLLCVLWSWLFWTGIVIGLVGGCALFFAKPGEGA